MKLDKKKSSVRGLISAGFCNCFGCTNGCYSGSCKGACMELCSGCMGISSTQK